MVDASVSELLHPRDAAGLDWRRALESATICGKSCDIHLWLTDSRSPPAKQLLREITGEARVL